MGWFVTPFRSCGVLSIWHWTMETLGWFIDLQSTVALRVISGAPFHMALDYATLG